MPSKKQGEKDQPRSKEQSAPNNIRDVGQQSHRLRERENTADNE